MSLTFSDVRRYIEESNILNLTAKFQFLKEDETEGELFTLDILDGSLDINYVNGVRRSCSLTLNNTDKRFLLNPQTFWVRQKFKLFLGYNINGQEFFFPQGVFVLSDISFSDVAQENSVTISGIDKFALLDGQLGGRLASTHLINRNISIAQAIADTLTEAGDAIDPVLDIGADTTPYTLYTEVGKTYGDILLEMNGMLSYNMYYDVNGVLRCEPEPDDIEKPVIWHYSYNQWHYQGGTQSVDTKEIYNAVKVIGNNINGDIANGYAENTNPDSYFSVDRLGGTPILAPVINDSIIPNDTYAQARAEYELKKLLAFQSAFSFASTPIYFLDVNQVITLTSTNLDLNRERHLINSINIPLNAYGGETTINATRTTDLSFT